MHRPETVLRYATVVLQRALARLLGDPPRRTARPVTAPRRTTSQPQRSPAPDAARLDPPERPSTQTTSADIAVAVGMFASLAVVGVVAPASASGRRAAASSPSAPIPATSRPSRGAPPFDAAPPGRPAPATLAQLALSPTSGMPGLIPAPQRAAPDAAADRTVWRAPEIKVLPPRGAHPDKRAPSTLWQTAPTDPGADWMSARRATPRPAHREPSSEARRHPELAGLARRYAHPELAGLAVARRLGDLIGIPAERGAAALGRAPLDGAALDQAVIAAAASVAASAPTPLADPDLVDVAHPAATGAAAARRGTVRTLIEGHDVADAVADEGPAGVRLESLAVVAAPHHTLDLERARIASSRAVAVLRGPTRRAERSIASGVAMLVVVLSLVGYSPLAPASAGTGNVGREASAPIRIAVGAFAGGAAPLQEVDGDTEPETALLAEAEPVDRTSAAISSVDLMPVETSAPEAPTVPSDSGVPLADRFMPDEEPQSGTGAVGPFNADGTLVKPVAVDTSIPDGKEQLRTYKIKRGDTATAIAKKFKLTTATVIWSNKLEDAAVLKVGASLVIPPVNGLVHVVQDGDTLSRIARRFNVDFERIMEANDLTETTVYLGQTLIIPGGRGEFIGTPPAAAGTDLSADDPARLNTVTLPSRTSTTLAPHREYNGGGFTWPFPGGTISQSFHYGHYAIDIYGDYGLPIVSAADGVVVFAGWKKQRRRLAGLGVARQRAVHHVQPHVGGLRRPRPGRGSGAAGRAQRQQRLGERAALPLRGVDRPRLGRRPARQPAELPLAGLAARHRRRRGPRPRRSGIAT